jgi:hypothetical protein
MRGRPRMPPQEMTKVRATYASTTCLRTNSTILAMRTSLVRRAVGAALGREGAVRREQYKMRGRTSVVCRGITQGRV